MVLNAADTLSDLTGWVTIDNQSGATYKDAALKLVAGDVNRARDPRREARMLDLAAKAASVAEASRDFQSEGFFEYHLYTLDGRTTIKDNQTKQLALLTSDEVPVTKQLIYYGAQDYYRNAYGVPIRTRRSRSTWSSGTARNTGSASRCRRGRSASTRRTGQAASNSSARTGSTTPPRTSDCASRWATPSTSSAAVPRGTGRGSPRTSGRSSGRSRSAITSRRSRR